ncbi:homogentisate 1,2-dioxygenase [Candidatus Marinimicrobia bacterium]|nr:homogentisate 1,2-dioxygenase [Candidatus Neomarinimicrobiota bacterium]
MPFYQKRGAIPNKRHIQFRDNSGNLYWEELISREGFSHMYSNVYHTHPPTGVEAVGEMKKINLVTADQTHRHHHIRTANMNSNGDAISSRIPLFFNSDLVISKAHVTESMKTLYRNGNADEVLFIHTGSGIFKSNLGYMDLKPGDYLVIPRGVIWQIDVKESMRILITESSGPIETPTRYRNKFGQLLEYSPFAERDFRTPEFAGPVDDSPMEVEVKLRHGIQTYGYQHHPFDVVGWDGYYFPYIFNIKDFMPITGKIHQPPPVHQTFQAHGFVICSFVPRLFDYHGESVPAPYAHSNVDSDEVIYYVEGNFMSRKDIDEESITYHPMGLPHGPQPGKVEESLGAKETNELAVMIDTFKPLNMTEAALKVDDEDYPYSWIES